ncbi:hypothetical protein CspeluHIS016_0504600 [Cutaneotrichosporon spelunceum]|uniref:Chitobiosyldiphosphodolichol beta-mannosyltransferase n=1 Tax=Cutaneotrichosporon spelunceum TaxID=1672016 RepID=A0AAD3TX95_9TREE|nr:hypothetical protein CspeluHIS016_0504600 [Cutaneotrichosporon spelunceum]
MAYFENGLSSNSWVILAIFGGLASIPLGCMALYARQVEKRPWKHKTATVLVLGDIGRSPRMMYHAESLAKAGWDTYMVGYGDTAPIPSLLETPRVHFLHLWSPPKLVMKLPWIIRAPIRILYQIASVVYLCVFAIPCNTQIFLVQNPPAIPTLLLSQIISETTRSKLIIDWHNTGYSILALRLGQDSRIVKWAKAFERRFGRRAYCHLFVTRALEEYLTREWHLQGRTAVLHDRPPSQFRRTEMITQLNLFRRIAPTITPPTPEWLNSTNIRNTAFTELTPTGIKVREDRPAFMVSSTSWTADEDFGLLLEALDMYQERKSSPEGKNLPRMMLIITGRGPLRKAFEKQVAERENSGKWTDVVVRCMFVSARDYPLILGCGDLGISMHQSSSGRDLPMKVVDMFGCGVPVLARGFACIDELVKDGINGRIFNTSTELADQLVETLAGFPHAPKLEALDHYFSQRAGASTPMRRVTRPGVEEEWSTWDENWDAVMRRGVLDFKRW